MTTNETKTAKRVQTVYYVVVNGENVDQASRPQAAKDKFAAVAAADTTSHVILRTGAGKVIEERPAAEIKAEDTTEAPAAVITTSTIAIPGLGDLSQDDLDQLAQVGAELKAANDKLAQSGAEVATDVLAGLADALGVATEDTEAPAAEVTPAETTEAAPAAQETTEEQPQETTEAPAAVVVDETTVGELKEQAAKPAPSAPAKEAKPVTSYDKMIEVFQAAVARGEMGAGSLAGYKAGVRKVLSVLESGMATDITKVDVEMALAVFEAKTPTLLDQTRKTYAADFKRALTLYRLYLADPKGFKFPARNVRATRLVAPEAK
jgi:hypothetical protein